MDKEIGEPVEIVNTENVLVPIDALKAHPDNARVGNVDAIVESIRAHGFYGTVIVRKSTGHILAGFHRWQAAKQVGLTEIPVTYVDVDAKTAKRILLADNRTSDLAGYDNESLAKLLGSIGSLDGTGWTDVDLNALLRTTGMRSADESSFLDDIEGEAASLDTLQSVEVALAPMTFMVSSEQKAELAEGLRRLMSENDIPTMTDALIYAVNNVAV
jgi:hypothetical protein